jgi:hypothetical protein
MADFSASAPMGTFQPGTAAAATSIVELSIAARNLLDMDTFSKSDPICVVSTKLFGSQNYTEIKRTECIDNNLNPEWVTKVQIKYMFEEQQHLKFDVYDMDSNTRDLSQHDFLGSCTVTLGQVVSAPAVLDLMHPKYNKGTCGSLIVSCEELSTCKDELQLQFLAKKLDKKDWFGSSDPFLRFNRTNEGGTYTVVHQTEHINNNCNPMWKKFTIPVRTLCNGDLDRNLKVECFDHNMNGNHALIGEFFITVRQLLEGAGPANEHPCINPKKKSKKSYKNSGVVHLVHVDMYKSYSFLDYIRGGTELAATISIDFTGSNGNPRDPNSLHYIQYGGKLNQYEQAIKSVGEIIEDYDSDKLFPVLGFGARLPPRGDVSHLFYVNGHPDNPYCERIGGVLSAYKGCISRVQLYGPTNFAPTVNHMAGIAREFVDGAQYFILLIITDGIITDMPQTKKAIVEASTLPLSIIIVGVGNADFDAMDELDGDDVRLTTPDGKMAARDIVQFVPFRNFLKKGMNSQSARLHLAKEVLAEIPDQFIGFMKANRIVPKPPINNPTRIEPPDPETTIIA